MADINTGTGAGLIEFLDRAATRGDINPSTASALKAAVVSVLSVEDNPDQLDIRALDVPEILQRFATLQRAKYTPASMKTYHSRFRNAVTMYRAWLANDPNWRKVVKPRRTTEADGRSPRPSGGVPNQALGTTTVHVKDHDVGVARETQERLVSHQFPLRPDLMVSLTLPMNMTAKDAARIAAFVKSLAFDAPTTSQGEPPWDQATTEEG